MNTKQKTLIMLLAAIATGAAFAGESVLKPLNDKGYGTVSGRIQSVSIYRDFDGRGNGANSTLGAIINYTSPEFAGFDAGLAYNYAGEIYDNNNTALLANDEINILNEAWGRYNFGALSLTNTTITVGRKINNAEVFRADDIRQKSRSIMAVQAESKDINNLRIAGGHAYELSGILQVGDRADFRNFGDIFGAPDDTPGVTWAEATYTGVEDLEVAAFDAIAWDVAEMVGTRVKYDITEKTAILGYLRFETNIGDAIDHDSAVLGASVVQKVGPVKLEGGYLGVYGDNLYFQQVTTGFNHALGASLMIYTGQYNGGADTLYFKATTRLEKAKTILYTLCNYTMQDDAGFDSAGEFDFIVKQPVLDNLTVCGKAGIAYRDGPDTLATDARLFLTYTF